MVDIEAIEDSEPTELPHLRVRFPPGQAHTLASMLVTNRYRVEYQSQPLTITLKPNTSFFSVKLALVLLPTSQTQRDERYCLSKAGHACVSDGDIFAELYQVIHRPGFKSSRCHYEYESACLEAHRERFKEQDFANSCVDHDVQVFCSSSVQKDAGTVMVGHVAINPEAVQLCSVFGCVPTHVGGWVRITPGASGTGKYFFKYTKRS